MDAPRREPSWSFGPFVLDSARRTLSRNGEPVAVTPKAFDILAVLAASGGQLVTKETLIRAVWPDTIVDEGNLTFQISTLRKALDDRAPGADRYIVTVPGRGYQLVTPVERVSGETAVEVTGVEPSGARGSRLASIYILAAAVMVASIAALVVLRPRGKQTANPTKTIQTLAVLPFKPLVATERDEALELGMAETLIAKISGIRGLTVRPLSAVRRYGRLEQDPIAAGRELGVDAVLDGSIHHAANNVRVTVRLLRVSDSQQLWSGQFETPFADIFSVHDAISRNLVDELSIKLTEEERNRLRKPETRNPNAYRAYVLGSLYASRLRRDSMLKGIDFYEQAIALDPQYARAYASLAGTHTTFILAADSLPGPSAAAARTAATRAIALDPGLAAAHAVLAQERFVYEWDWRGAEAEYRRAVAIEPSNARAHLSYALLLSNTGRHAEALRHADEALRLDPVEVMVNTQRGDYLRAAGKVDEAIAAQKHALEIAPDFWVADIHLGKAYEDKGMVSEAVEAYRAAYEHSGRTSEPLARAGHLLGKSGRKTEARKILSELLARSKKSYVPACNIAMVYTGLGEKAEAVRWLRRACADRDGNMAYMKVEPLWAALRNEPGFADIERCVNLP